jgi:hypothetical protein
VVAVVVSVMGVFFMQMMAVQRFKIPKNSNFQKGSTGDDYDRRTAKQTHGCR